MGTTTRGYPYPDSGDAPNVPADMGALADAVDADVALMLPRATWAGRNVIQNAQFNIWQRGTLLDTTGVYKADRWMGYRAAATTSAYVKQYATGSVTAPPQGLMLQRHTGSETNLIKTWQAVESVNARILANKQVTLSYWAYHGAGYSAAAKRIFVTLGTGTGTDQAASICGSWTGNATPIATWQTITGTWTRYTHTATLSAATNQIYVMFETDAFVGAAPANDFVHITGVQLEEGATASAFEYKDIGTDLAECQRYFQKSYSQGVTPGTNTAVGVRTATCDSVQSALRHFIHGQAFPVTMRTTPSTVAIYSEDGTVDRISAYNDSTIKLTFSSLSGTGDSSLGTYIQTTGVGTGNMKYVFHYTASADM